MRTCTPLPPGVSLTVADVSSARLQAYSTAAHAWALFGTFLESEPPPHRANWSTFSFLPTWHDLTRAAKDALYCKHACRELNAFLAHRDPAYLGAVALPLLRAKLGGELTLLEEWWLATYREEEAGGSAAGRDVAAGPASQVGVRVRVRGCSTARASPQHMTHPPHHDAPSTS